MKCRRKTTPVFLFFTTDTTFLYANIDIRGNLLYNYNGFL